MLSFVSGGVFSVSKKCSKFRCSRPERFEVPAVVLHELSATATNGSRVFNGKDLRQVPTKLGEITPGKEAHLFSATYWGYI